MAWNVLEMLNFQKRLKKNLKEKVTDYQKEKEEKENY